MPILQRHQQERTKKWCILGVQADGNARLPDSGPADVGQKSHLAWPSPWSLCAMAYGMRYYATGTARALRSVESFLECSCNTGICVFPYVLVNMTTCTCPGARLPAAGLSGRLAGCLTD